MSTNNIFCDLGNLLVSDSNPLNQDLISEEEIQAKALANTKIFFGELYNLLKTQKGNDDEHRDFDKEADNVTLPKGQLILPRAKRIPKEKPLTRWEKFRLERGLPPRQKRSRMVFNELANDWVPRWGKGR
jgi:regulator of ribosome biosynthesis